MLKCKYELCKYPNCPDEELFNCGANEDTIITTVIQEREHYKRQAEELYSALRRITEIAKFNAKFPIEPPPDEYACPFCYEECINNPVYVRRYHPETWEEDKDTSCWYWMNKPKEVFGPWGCPFYDDEDK